MANMAFTCRKIVAEFVRYARGEGEPTTSPLAAREAVATGCRGTESICCGSVPLDVPILSAKILKHFANADTV